MKKSLNPGDGLYLIARHKDFKSKGSFEYSYLVSEN